MSPARLLAPVALVAAAIALFAVVTSGPATNDPGSAAEPAATATPRPKTRATATATASSGGTYTVKPGDTPSGIAEKLDLDVDDLLAANPDIDPAGLTIGEELELP